MPRRAGIGLMLAAALMLVVLPACQVTEEHPKAAVGAGVGAVGGALIGGLAGGRRGMIYGALAGALTGVVVGAVLDHQDKTAAETNTTHNYKADQGVQLQIESATADPQTVSPGKDVALKMTYTVMAPDPQQQVNVTERRLVTLNGQMVVDRSTDVSRTPGTWTSALPVTLPDSAPKGTYQMEVTVSSGGQSNSMTTTFTVQ